MSVYVVYAMRRLGGEKILVDASTDADKMDEVWEELITDLRKLGYDEVVTGIEKVEGLTVYEVLDRL